MDIYAAMSIINQINVYDNYINIKGYGVGIAIKDNYSNIHDNRINNKHDTGISLLGNFNIINNNIIISCFYCLFCCIFSF